MARETTTSRMLVAQCKDGGILMKGFAVLVVLAVMVSAIAAGNSVLGGVEDAVNQLCTGLTSLLPIASMLGIVLAGVIYAAGQMMGAETRARANVWATAALTGALIAILMAVVAPAVLTTIYGSTVSCTVTSAPGIPVSQVQ